MKFTAADENGKIPKYLPVAFRPIEPDGDLGMRGMTVQIQRVTGLPVGIVGASYDDAKMGPRCYVKFGTCTGWFSVYDVEPVEPVEPSDLPPGLDVFG